MVAEPLSLFQLINQDTVSPSLHSHLVTHHGTHPRSAGYAFEMSNIAQEETPLFQAAITDGRSMEYNS